MTQPVAASSPRPAPQPSVSEAPAPDGLQTLSKVVPKPELTVAIGDRAQATASADWDERFAHPRGGVVLELLPARRGGVQMRGRSEVQVDGEGLRQSQSSASVTGDRAALSVEHETDGRHHRGNARLEVRGERGRAVVEGQGDSESGTAEARAEASGKVGRVDLAGSVRVARDANGHAVELDASVEGPRTRAQVQAQIEPEANSGQVSTSVRREGARGQQTLRGSATWNGRNARAEMGVAVRGQGRGHLRNVSGEASVNGHVVHQDGRTSGGVSGSAGVRVGERLEATVSGSVQAGPEGATGGVGLAIKGRF